uniref:Photosynthetic NDH subunit of subcomplex B 4, chloroplastic n=1 Tax=Aegilops tauschii TaxID=37682 RepID=M8BZ63_AEGTA
MASSLLKPHSHCSALPSGRSGGLHGGSCPATARVVQGPAGRRGDALKARAFPLDVVPLMVTMVEHVDNQRDWVVTKSIWHLSDTAIKSFCETSVCASCTDAASVMSETYVVFVHLFVRVDTFYAMFTDPFYDSEHYRGQGGDGTVHWYYDRQEDIEATARGDLLREELLEEIEQRVGGLRELEDAGMEGELEEAK